MDSHKRVESNSVQSNSYGSINVSEADLSAFIPSSHLPRSLKLRLLRDMAEREQYERLTHISQLRLRQPNASWGTHKFGCFLCQTTFLVDAGKVGMLKENETFSFLDAGYHAYCCAGISFEGTADINTVNRAIVFGSAGFVTVAEGYIGVLMVGADYRLLAAGTYQWENPAVRFEGAVAISDENARLGPFSLVTVAEGQVAATYNNGTLHILGHRELSGSRSYFLDDPKWLLGAFLSTAVQTDRLEGNDLLSKDNVELLMVAMSEWRIVDPVAAVTHCSPDMDGIRTKVNQLVRAAIARIVAGTNIGAGPVSGSMAKPIVEAVAVAASGHGGKQHVEEADLAHMMQSSTAARHMGELSANMAQMGVEVIGVFVPEKRMKNDDIREQVARQAVIGIKADAERSAADARAYAMIAESRAAAEAKRQMADAEAYSRVTSAKAEAEAIQLVSVAQAEAGQTLGTPESTAARLALTDRTATALAKAKVTIFSGAPSKMPFMLSESL
ncbi:transmembrane protein, putative [Bodo saltans]|uniref:Transmembrane protein, putative n=1 Tax=Bodo saltans TaxID=75058 RepID=A0A0S4ISD9_BODSA|nr:transmembrane protein, putative [Bodo saltans]|eukprot:CUF54605.1 transmembrane protein, putative [Bodo saltans]